MIWWESMVTQVKGTDPRVKRTRRFLQQAIFELVQKRAFRPESYHSDGLVKRAIFSYTTVAIKNGFRFV